MKVTVYLPDEIGEKAKQHELNLSGLLRAAVEEEIMRQEAVAENSDGMEEIILDLKDDNDLTYRGRFTGKLLVEDGHGYLYRKEDGTLLFHYYREKKYLPLEVDELEDFLSHDSYVAAMHALGETPIIDI